MNTKNTNALHELQWRTENRKKKQTTPAKKEITIDKNTAKAHLIRKLYTQAGGIEINTIIGKLYVYGFISTFKKH